MLRRHDVMTGPFSNSNPLAPGPSPTGERRRMQELKPSPREGGGKVDSVSTALAPKGERGELIYRFSD
jgi:hypothetical protein